MNDTSLLSSTTEQTPNSAEETKTETPAAEQPDSEKSAADKLYNDAPAEEKPEGETQDEPAADDKPESEKDAEGAGDDEEKPKDEQAEDDQEGSDEDEPAEPFDLSDIEFDLPEGMELNEEVLTELGSLAAELGVKNKEDAAKLVPLGVKLMENYATKQQEQYVQTRSEWRDAVAADKEIGGVDEAAQKEKLVIANKGLEAIGNNELRAFLDETGLGDHPEMIRAFYKAGLSASEDVMETGGSGDTAKSGLDAMYPSMAEKK